MSAELFRTSESRIPVAATAGTFRRCSSMRLRGEGGSARATRADSTRPPHAAITDTPAQHPQRPAIAGHDARHHAAAPHHHHFSTASRQRSLSLSLSSPRLTSVAAGGGVGVEPTTPPASPAGRRYLDDDVESVQSYASGASTASCEHPHIAHNGTTFSGRSMRYVVHCGAHAGADQYLTPTQRAQRQIKRLKALLHQAKHDIEQKDSDIFRLTKEVVELRLYKASLNSPDDKSNSSEAVTVRENATDDLRTPDSPTCTDFTDDARTAKALDMHSSFADSGHFEDLNNSKDSVVATCDKACWARLDPDEEHRRVIDMYERRLDELVRVHGSETHDLKQKHNDKIEELLQRLSDVNLRYCQLVPNYEQAREKIQELEKQLDEVNKQLQEQEEKHKQLYLEMYNKGVQAAKLEQQEQVMALAQQTPARVSVSELLQQLQVTQTELENIKDTAFLAEHSPQAQSLLSAKEAVSLWVLGARKVCIQPYTLRTTSSHLTNSARHIHNTLSEAMYRRLVEMRNSKSEMDPEITLQFLKSAIYYFLTDKDNHQGHLRAIQSILGFTPSEISNIDKARVT